MMKAIVNFVIFTMLGLILAGCAQVTVQDYAQEKPNLDLRDYFNGNITAHGIFTDRQGKVVKRFTVAMTGKWKGEDGVLDEKFTYSDGTTSTRIWNLTHLGNGKYQGRAADVEGIATGKSAGNSFYWAYTLNLPVDGTTYAVHMKDWMFLIDEKVMINQASMNKFGLEWGRVNLVFIKH